MIGEVDMTRFLQGVKRLIYRKVADMSAGWVNQAKEERTGQNKESSKRVQF